MKRRILIVEDDPTTVHMAEKLLINDGYDVISAIEGKLGLELAKNSSPDLILLDILLPDIDGVEVARNILSNNKTKDIPIVFMTVMIKLEDDKGDEIINVDGHEFRGFAKPIHKRKLLNVIRKEINKKIHRN